MNSLHYPSLELCKKLTEIGFPFTENQLLNREAVCLKCWSVPPWPMRCNCEYEEWIKIHFVYPSAMEMLDYIRQNNVSMLGISFLSPELPDALAESIISSLIK